MRSPLANFPPVMRPVTPYGRETGMSQFVKLTQNAGNKHLTQIKNDGYLFRNTYFKDIIMKPTIKLSVILFLLLNCITVFPHEKKIKITLQQGFFKAGE